MKTANMKFGEAVRTLAADAGLPIYKFSKLDEEREKKWREELLKEIEERNGF